MLKFYRNAAIAGVVLLLVTALILCAGMVKSKLSTSLFPKRDGQLVWAPAIEPSAPVDETRLTVKSEVGTIDYEFFLDPKGTFPYTHYSFYFIDSAQPYKLVDLTRYSHVSFRILCDPKNVLLFVLFSYDDRVTDPIRPVTRRVSSTAFSCDNQWTTLTIGFDELDTPHWWLDRYGYEFSDTGYRLDKTMGIAFVNSLQSPVNTRSHVRLTDVKLEGRAEQYLYLAALLCVLIWVLFFFWLFRQYITMLTAGLKEKIRLDQPLIAYKKLSIEPQKDKEKSAVLRLIATEYANPDLSLESVTLALGLNRTKVNEILKEELGMTFTAYLNKLRLTEAARLLSEKEEANVSEIAYLVGYNNASYFNKLFKIEYGCTPKTFKTLHPLKEDCE
ncbi:helix-turn-helix domain-containing protein [Cellvibrio sp. ARAG 10.3]|uniref:helix-turn-helix domain-containing protein n=1 Tax=Cellvibrio sp. ARAG 10.3 TaxID=3451358 RepID=UPI003F46C32F